MAASTAATPAAELADFMQQLWKEVDAVNDSPALDTIVVGICNSCARVLDSGYALEPPGTQRTACLDLLQSLFRGPRRDRSILALIEALLAPQFRRAQSEFVKVRESLLHVCLNMTTIGGDSLSEYGEAMFWCALQVLRREHAAAPAVSCVALIRRLLETRIFVPPTQVRERLFADVSLALGTSTRPFATADSAKGALLSLRGFLVGWYKDCLSPAAADAAYGCLMGALADKGSSMAVICGCLNGLSSLIKSMPGLLDWFEPGADNTDPKRFPSALLDHVIAAIRKGALPAAQKSEKSKQEQPQTALHFFAAHAQLLSRHVLPRSHELFDLLYLAMHLKSREKVRYAAPAAMVALLEVVALSVAAGTVAAAAPASSSSASAAASPKREFDWFVSERFMTMVKGGGMLPSVQEALFRSYSSAVAQGHVAFSAIADVRMALKGCGIFSASIARFHAPGSVLQQVVISMLGAARALVDDEAGQAQASGVRGGGPEQRGGVFAPEDLGDPSRAGGGGGGGEVDATGEAQALRPFLSSPRNRVSILADALTAASAMLLHLPPRLVEADKLFSQLCGMAEELALAFPLLSPGPKGGRPDVARAMLAFFLALSPTASPSCAAGGGAPAPAYTSSLLTLAVGRIVPGLFLRTTSRVSDWVVQSAAGGGAGGLGAEFSVPAAYSHAGLSLVHPISCAQEERLLFEYIPLWRELLNPTEPGCVRLLKSLVASRLSVSPAGAAGAASSVPVVLHFERDDEDDLEEEEGGSATGVTAEPPPSSDDGGGEAGAEDMVMRDGQSSEAAPSLHATYRRIIASIRTAVYDALAGALVQSIESSDLSLAQRSSEFAAGDALGHSRRFFSSSSSVTLSSDSVMLALSMASASSAAAADADWEAGGDGLGAENPAASVCPACPVAYDRFLALVEFVRYGLPLLPYPPLHGWLYPLVRACVRGAGRFPHVSGFLTLLTVLTVLGEETDFFRPPSAARSGAGDAVAAAAAAVRVPPADALHAVGMLGSFAVEVGHRLRQYKGELLLACVRFILLLPRSVLERGMGSDSALTTSTLGVALQVGAGQPALAVLGLRALGSLHRLSPALLAPHLSRLLPFVGAIVEQGQLRCDAEASAAVAAFSAAKGEAEGGDDADAAEDDERAQPQAPEGEDEEDSSRLAKLGDILRKKPSYVESKRLHAALVGTELGRSEAASGTSASREQDLTVHYSSALIASLTTSGLNTEDEEDEELELLGGGGVATAQTAGGLHGGLSRRIQVMLRFVCLRETETRATALHLRALSLLGRLGGAAVAHVAGDVAGLLADELSWSAATPNNKRLSVPLLLSGVKHELQLEAFIPLVSALAKTASTRRTKVAACELLHSLCLVLVGRIINSRAEALDVRPAAPGALVAPTPYVGVFARLMPGVLELAVQAEGVAQQLFAPLALQLMRLFSKYDDRPETRVLIDAVCTALTGSDSALRDFAATCFADFVKWTIKHKPVEVLARGNAGAAILSELAGDSRGVRSGHAPTSSSAAAAAGGGSRAPTSVLSIDALLRRLCSAARHVSPFQRLGACMAWNHVYRFVREEDALVSRYILFIADHMLHALRSAAADGSAVSGTAAAAAMAVDHCSRIIVRKADRLALPDESRSVQSPQTLGAFVCSTFLACALVETQARRKAMQLFDELAPLAVKLCRSATGPGALPSYAAPKQLTRLLREEGLTPSAALAAAPSSGDNTDQSSSVSAWVRQFCAGEGCALQGMQELGTATTVAQTIRAGSGPSTLIAMAEGCLQRVAGATGAGLSHAGSVGSSLPTAASMLERTDALAASLDIYTWLFTRGFAAPELLLGQQESESRSSSAPSSATLCVRWTREFLDTCAGVLLPPGGSGSSSNRGSQVGETDALVRLVAGGRSMLLPGAVSKLRRSRAILACRLITLVTVVLPAASASATAPRTGAEILREAGLLGDSFWRFLIICVAHPSLLAVEDDDSAAVASAGGAGVYIPLAAQQLLDVVHRLHATAPVEHKPDFAGFQGSACAAAVASLRGCDAILALPSALLSRGIEGSPLGMSHLRELIRAVRMLHSVGLLERVLRGLDAPTNSAAEADPRGAPVSTLSFAASLGTAVWSLPSYASPRELLIGRELLQLALVLEWPWEIPVGSSRSFGGSMSLAACLGLIGSTASSAENAGQTVVTFYHRYSSCLVPHLLRADMWASGLLVPVPEQRSEGASNIDRRITLGNYPVLQRIVSRLLLAASTAGSAEPPNSASDDAASAHRDFAWGLLQDLVRFMAMSTSQAKVLLSMDEGGAERGAGGAPGNLPPAASSGSPAAPPTAVASQEAAALRPAVFVNSLIAMLPHLVPLLPAGSSSSSSPTPQEQEGVLRVTQVLRTLAAFDPWLLISAPPPDTSSSSAGAVGSAAAAPSRGAQVRHLSPAAVGAVLAAFEGCVAPTIHRSRGSSASMAAPGEDRLAAAFLELLPSLIPGYVATCRIAASLVAPGSLDASPGASAGAASLMLLADGGGLAAAREGRELNSVYAVALQLLQSLIAAVSPLRSSELFEGYNREQQLTRFRRVLRASYRVAALTGSLRLLQMLHPSISEGETGLCFGEAVGALRAIASTVAPDGESALAVLRECLLVCFRSPASGFRSPPDAGASAARSDTEPRLARILCEHLAVPLLQRLRPSQVESIFIKPDFFRSLLPMKAPTPLLFYPVKGGPTLLLAYLVLLVTEAVSIKEGAGKDPEPCSPADSRRVSRTAMACQLLACMFEVLPKETVKERIEPALGQTKFNGNTARKLRILVSAELQQYRAHCSSITMAHVEALRLRQAAFAAMLSLMIKTQPVVGPINNVALNVEAETESAGYGPIYCNIVNCGLDTIPSGRRGAFSISRSCPEAGELHPLRGMPVLSDATAFGSTSVSLDKFMASLPTPAAVQFASATQLEGESSSLAGSQLSLLISRGVAGGTRGAGVLAAASQLSQPYNPGAVVMEDGAEAEATGGAGSRRSRISRSARSAAGGGSSSTGLFAEGTASLAASALGEVGGEGIAGGEEGDVMLVEEEEEEGGLFALREQHPQAPTGAGRQEGVEMDYFNSLPPMLPLLRLLDHIQTLDPAPPAAAAAAATASAAPVDMPQWMSGMLRGVSRPRAGASTASASRPGVGRNSEALPARLFIVKVVLNRPAVFAPWAHKWSVPIMEAMLDVDGWAREQQWVQRNSQVVESCIPPARCGQLVFHYMLRDVCVLLCYEWGSGGSPGGGPEPFKPSTASEASVCSAFLTLVMASAATTNGYLLRAHLAFLGVLITRWVGGGEAAATAAAASLGCGLADARAWAAVVRPDEKTLGHLLLTKDTSSVSNLSFEGARIAVGVAVIQYVMQVGERPFVPALIPPIPNKPEGLTIRDFYGTAIVGKFTSKVENKVLPTVTLQRIADLVGLILATSAQRRGQEDGGHGAPSSSSSSSSGGGGVGADWGAVHHYLLFQTRAELGTMFQRCQTQSGVDTNDRGFLRFLYSAALVAGHYPAVLTQELVLHACTPLAMQRGRAYTKGAVYEQVLLILLAAFRGSGKEVKMHDLVMEARRHLPLLLKAQVAGRGNKAPRVQKLALELLNVLLRIPSHAETAATAPQALGTGVPILGARFISTLLTPLEPHTYSLLLRLFVQHPSVACRLELYRFLIGAWEALPRLGQQEGDGAPAASPGSSGRQQGERLSSAQGEALRTAVRSALLAALFDNDSGVRAQVYAFWNASGHLSASFPSRLSQLLGDVADGPAAGAQPWLHFAPSLLLSLAHREASFTDANAIFDAPLDRNHAAFLSAAVETGGVGEAALATGAQPLFASGAGSLAATQAWLRGASQQLGGGGFLRATQLSQQRQFTMTMQSQAGGGGGAAAGASSHRGPGGGGLVSSFVPDPIAFGQRAGLSTAWRRAAAPGASSLGSLAAAGQSQHGGAPALAVSMRAALATLQAGRPISSLAGASQRQGGSQVQGAGALHGIAAAGAAPPAGPMGAYPAAADPTQSQGVTRIRTRIWGAAPSGQGGPAASSTTASTTGHFEELAFSNSASAKAQGARRRLLRTQACTLTRSYRIGELPDIQIPVSEIVLPLQELCSMDARIARRLFAALFGWCFDAATGDGPRSRSKRQRQQPPPGSSSSASSAAAGPAGAPPAAPLSKSLLRSRVRAALQNMRHPNAVGAEDGAPSSPAPPLVTALLHDLLCCTLASDVAASTSTEMPPGAFSAEPGLVGHTALDSLQYSTGIRTLEEALAALQLSSEAMMSAVAAGARGAAGIPLIPPTAGTATSQDPDVTALSLTAHRRKPPPAFASPAEQRAAWVQLTSLYAALGHEDVVSGLLECAVFRSTPLLSRAAHLQECGDLRGAADSYTSAIAAWRAAAASSSEAASSQSPVWKRRRVDGGGDGGGGASEPLDEDDSEIIEVVEAQAPRRGHADGFDDDDDDAGVAEQQQHGRSSRPAVARSSADTGAGAAATEPTLDEVLEWDARRLACLSALQDWGSVEQAIACVGRTGLPCSQFTPARATGAGYPSSSSSSSSSSSAAEGAGAPSAAGAVALSGAEEGRLDPWRRSILQSSWLRQAVDAMEVAYNSTEEEEVDAARARERGLMRLLQGGGRGAGAVPLVGGALSSSLSVAPAHALAQGLAQLKAREFEQASASLSTGLGAIASLYSGLSPLAIEARSAALVPTQSLVESHEFLRMYKLVARLDTAAAAASASSSSSSAAASSGASQGAGDRRSAAALCSRLPALLLTWRSRSASSNAAVSMASAVRVLGDWDAILTSRRLMMCLLSDRLLKAAHGAGARIDVSQTAALSQAVLRTTCAQAAAAACSAHAFGASERLFHAAFASTTPTRSVQVASADTPVALLQLPLQHMQARVEADTGGEVNATEPDVLVKCAWRLAQSVRLARGYEDALAKRSEVIQALDVSLSSGILAGVPVGPAADVKDALFRDKMYDLGALTAEAGGELVRFYAAQPHTAVVEARAITAKAHAAAVKKGVAAPAPVTELHVINSAVRQAMTAHATSAAGMLYAKPFALEGLHTIITAPGSGSGSSYSSPAGAAGAMLGSIARCAVAKRAAACANLALFADSLLRQWEDDGAALRNKDASVAAALRALVTSKSSSEEARAQYKPDVLAATLVRNVLLALALDPAAALAGAPAAPSSSSAAATASPLRSRSADAPSTEHSDGTSLQQRLASHVDRTLLATTLAIDDCGVMPGPLPSVRGRGEGGGGAVDSAVALLPRALELVSLHDSARDAFCEGMRMPPFEARQSSEGEVPLHAFLPWIPQLLAMLMPQACAAAGVPPASSSSSSSASSSAGALPLPRGAPEAAEMLRRLASAYPQAVYYSYRLSSASSPTSASLAAAGEAPASAAATPAVWQLTAPLRRVLDIPLLSCFVTALEQLDSPEKRFDSWVRQVSEAVLLARKHSRDKKAELPPAAQLAFYAELQRTILCVGSPVAPGTHLLRWIHTWRREIATRLKEGKGLLLDAVRALHAEMARVQAGPPGGRARDPLPSQVAHLSMWLSSFNAADYPTGTVIEMPGCYDGYTGRTAPRPEAHAYIVAVAPEMQCMASLRVPKRVSFISQTEASLPFLVKGGEDLRADQRSQQFLRAANGVFAADHGAAVRRLGVRTFAVVPMSPNIGVVEWVSGTTTLKSAIEGAANARLAAAAAAAVASAGARSSRGGVHVLLGGRWSVSECDAAMSITKWIHGFSSNLAKDAQGRLPPSVIYQQPYNLAGVDQAEGAWESAQRHMPPDLLRSAVVGLAPSAESYIAVRANYARSLAAFSVAGYVLGVGDRHLDNSLLDVSSGALVPIDFGAVFGYATAMLGVAELIPFRLSPQLLYVLAPLPTDALLRRAMSVALGALSSEAHSRSVTAVLDVFSREPLAEWLAHAHRRIPALISLAGSGAGAGGKAGAVDGSDEPPDGDDEDGEPSGGGGEAGTTTLEAHAWLPSARVLLARLKLRRANPAGLVLIDLLQNGNVVPMGTTLSAKHTETRNKLVTRLRRVVYGGGRPSAPRVRYLAENNAHTQLRPFERSLLEAALGPFAKELDIGSITDAAAEIAAGGLVATCPSVTAQVDCLLDLAMDPNVLVRQYQGLALWA